MPSPNRERMLRELGEALEALAGDRSLVLVLEDLHWSDASSVDAIAYLAQRTRPALVHEFVSDLYRFELRRLRDRLVAREFPKTEYFGRVVGLRRQYWLISMRAGDWVRELETQDLRI